ncbi:DMT family transporter [Acinetobacter boissieri]|uniref:EamA-like transporter family protein n=1 Tax=Acinetobacter boissieri TaxID=1219383 RepID=A0A1G6GYS7_9GAMM|nr:DMT family transporter [Acinetobacter boissieri]SDB87220.1 EamA-like transporter family protein [Acinetobacter boissieri]
MLLIFLAALCSVGVSLIVKKYLSQGLNILAIITWNYAVASLLCFLWFKPDMAHLIPQNVPWWLIVLLGALLPSIFFALSKSLQHAGMIKTEIVQRLSVVLSILAAYIVFNESMSALKFCGFTIGVVAVVLMVLQKTSMSQPNLSSKGIWALVAVWVGYALVDILLKYNSRLGLGFAISLNLIFVFAGMLSLLATFIKAKKQLLKWQNICAGLIVGMLNFANIALYVNAHRALHDSPAIVFASMNILVVVFGVMSGVVLFKEKLTPRLSLSVTMAIVAVLCLMLAMKPS